jgi:hypothetical protein
MTGHFEMPTDNIGANSGPGGSTYLTAKIGGNSGPGGTSY